MSPSRGKRVVLVKPQVPKPLVPLLVNVDAGTITALPRHPPINRVAFLPDGHQRAIWLPLSALREV